MSFEQLEDVEPGSQVYSEIVNISGISEPVDVSIVGGSFSVNGAAFSSEDSLIGAGQSLQLGLVSPQLFASVGSARVTIGDVTVIFSVRTVADNQAPEAKITFPSGRSIEQYSVATISGTASDNDRVTSVRVNDIAATSTNEFSTWTARIPLNPGLNEINVSVTDRSGNTVSIADSGVVDNQAFLDWPQSIVTDGNIAYLGDETYSSVYSVDLSTGLRQLISDERRGSGAPITGVDAIALDKSSDRLFVADAYLDVIVAVNISNGNRSLISGEDKGDGPLFNALDGFYYDSENSRLLATDRAAKQVVSIDVSTGNRRVLSNSQLGAGLTFDEPRDLVYDRANNSAYVGDAGRRAVFRVDLATGDRTIVSGEGVGTGVRIVRPWALEFDSENSKIFVLNISSVGGAFDPDFHGIIEVDLANGNRQLISGRTEDGVVGEGFDFGLPTDFALLENSDEFVVGDFGSHRLSIVDATSGARSALSEPSGISSTSWGRRLRSLSLDSVSQRLLIADLYKLTSYDLNDATTAEIYNVGEGNEILASLLHTATNDTENVVFDGEDLPLSFSRVDLQSREVRNLFNLQDGDIVYGLLKGFDVDREENQLFYITTGNYLVQIDLLTLERKVLASPVDGAGSTVRFIDDLYLDEERNRIIILDDGIHTLYGVDIDTQEREIITSFRDEVGDGIGIGGVRSMDIDLERSSAWILSTSERGEIHQVDLVSGNRMLISSEDNLGPSIRFTKDLKVDAVRHSAYVLDSNRDRLIQVDLVSGDRAVIYP